jgi:hypothetical protein
MLDVPVSVKVKGDQLSLSYVDNRDSDVYQADILPGEVPVNFPITRRPLPVN